MTPTPTKARRQTIASNWLRHFIFPLCSGGLGRLQMF
jgi:hypothetical protein